MIFKLGIVVQYMLPSPFFSSFPSGPGVSSEDPPKAPKSKAKAKADPPQPNAPEESK